MTGKNKLAISLFRLGGYNNGNHKSYPFTYIGSRPLSLHWSYQELQVWFGRDTLENKLKLKIWTSNEFKT